jgi:hypothetical protein
MKAIIDISESIQEISGMLKRSFTSDYHPDKNDLIRLKEKLSKANDLVSPVTGSMQLVRGITRLITQVNNIEKLISK